MAFFIHEDAFLVYFSHMVDIVKSTGGKEPFSEEKLCTSLKRAGAPEDVANAIYLLCLPESEMINGHTLFVDAGYSRVG